MPRQWGCPKAPTHGLPLGEYAVRLHITPSLKSEIRHRENDHSEFRLHAAYADPRRHPGSRNRRRMPLGGRKSLNFSRDLRGRQMSDTDQLSDTAATQLAGAGQRGGCKGDQSTG
jgi:hypothetical protein